VSGQSWRNRLLGFSAIVFAVAAALFMVSNLLQFIDALQSHALVGFSVGSGFSTISPLLAIPALAVAGVAFLLGPSRRAARLGTATVLLALGFSLGLVGDVIFASVAAAHDLVKKVIAGFSAEAAGDLWLAVAATVAAVAFFASTARGKQVLPRRDGLLGWGSASVAAAFVFMTTSTILFLVLYSDAGAVGSYTTGYGIAAGGDAAAVIASAVAAAGFFVSSWRQRKDQPRWPAGRDVTLGVATAIFALAFLVTAVGVLVIATADPENGIKGKQAAADWLGAMAYFGLMVTAACASIGFFLSRSKPTG